MPDLFTRYLSFLHLPFFNSASSSTSNLASAGKVLDTTKTIADTASRSFAALHAPSLSSGELFALFVIVGVLLLALTLGSTRTLVSAVSVYIAFALQSVFPFFDWLLKHQSLTNDLPTLHVWIFLILYAIIFGLLNRSILKSRFNLGESSFLLVVLMGIAQLGLIISIILNLAPKFYNIAAKIPFGLSPYFSGPTALFYWALVPVILILFSKQSD